jgi:hypothetical protein
MQGIKTGGRQIGTPNRVTSELRDIVAERFPNYNPILSLIEIAQDTSNEVSLRLQANKEVAKYLMPQLKSVEIKEADTETKIIVVRYSDENRTQIIEKP